MVISNNFRTWVHVPTMAVVCATSLLCPKTHSIAQVIPDTTLPSNSVVSGMGNQLEVVGGTSSGSSLFHSFSDFSIPDNVVVTFTSPLNVENIFSRVTGSSISDIDGVIQSISDANLFLINPNGITFGENSQLSVGGSFLASTANYIQFPNDLSFSTVDTDFQPLLTVGVPVGLGFVTQPSTLINRSFTGLEVPNSETIALIGGSVLIEGGGVFAEDGLIEIGSIDSGGFLSFDTTSLPSSNSNLSFDYLGISDFQDIVLRAAFIDASGEGNGSINLHGKQISISEDSFVSISTLGAGTQSKISIGATDTIELSGDFTGVATESLGSGDAGDIDIRTNSLIVRNGAFIGTQAIGDSSAQPGDLKIQASESVEVIGATSDLSFPSSIISSVANDVTNQEKRLEILTGQLNVREGAQIFTENLGAGQGVNLSIVASEEVILSEDVPGDEGFPSGLFARSLPGSVGSGGTINLSTQRLTVEKGAQISTDVQGGGSAGNLIIDSTQSIQLLGTSEEGFASGLFAQVEEGATGDAGEIFIDTNQLEIINGAQVSSSARGEGRSGRLTLDIEGLLLISGTSFLEDGRSASSVLVSAEPGSIRDAGFLEVNADRLIVEDGGKISADNFGSGEGSQAIINVRQLIIQSGGRVGAGSLDIPDLVVASALGDGGNLTVNATEKIEIKGNRVLNSEVINSQLFTRAEGAGSAGTLNINERDGGQLIVIVGEGAEISASTVSSTGGNIVFNNPNIILLRSGGSITAEAGSSQNAGDGGNVTFSLPDGFILAVPNENSDIVANAFSGTGGNINITAQNIIGLDQRRATPSNITNDIDASSEFGTSGTVAINNLEFDPTQGLIQLPTDPAPPTQVAERCLADSKDLSAFVITGQGGASPSPSDIVRNATAFSTNADTRTDTAIGTPTNEPNTSLIAEAQGWQKDSNGEVVLMTQAEASQTQTFQALSRSQYHSCIHPTSGQTLSQTIGQTGE